MGHNRNFICIHLFISIYIRYWNCLFIIFIYFFDLWIKYFFVGIKKIFFFYVRKNLKIENIFILTYTSSHCDTYRTNLESRNSLTNDKSFAKRSMRRARPACRIWNESEKSWNGSWKIFVIISIFHSFSCFNRFSLLVFMLNLEFENLNFLALLY